MYACLLCPSSSITSSATGQTGLRQFWAWRGDDNICSFGIQLIRFPIYLLDFSPSVPHTVETLPCPCLPAVYLVSDAVIWSGYTPADPHPYTHTCPCHCLPPATPPFPTTTSFPTTTCPTHHNIQSERKHAPYTTPGGISTSGLGFWKRCPELTEKAWPMEDGSLCCVLLCRTGTEEEEGPCLGLSLPHLHLHPFLPYPSFLGMWHGLFVPCLPLDIGLARHGLAFVPCISSFLGILGCMRLFCHAFLVCWAGSLLLPHLHFSFPHNMCACVCLYSLLSSPPLRSSATTHFATHACTTTCSRNWAHFAALQADTGVLLDTSHLCTLALRTHFPCYYFAASPF